MTIMDNINPIFLTLIPIGILTIGVLLVYFFTPPFLSGKD